MVAAPTTTKRSSKQLFKQMAYAEDSDSDKEDDDDNDDDSSCSDSDTGSDGSEEDVEPVMIRPSKSKSDSNLNEDLTVGMHIVIEYECELFPGTITEILPDKRVRVNCIEKGCVKGSTWRWLERKDEGVYPVCDI